MNFIKKMPVAMLFIAIITISSDSFASANTAERVQQVAPVNASLEASVYTDGVVTLERKKLEQAIIDTEAIKTAATLIINAANEQLAKSEISQLQAAKIIGEQNYIIEQAKAQLAEMTKISIGNVKDTEAQESYLNQLISGAQAVGTGLLEKIGYNSTAREKAIAQAIIDQLNNQLKNLEKEYTKKMNAAADRQDKMRISREFKIIKQEFENEIYRQQVITEKVMSTNKKLFLSAVGLAGAAAGSALAYKYLSAEMPGKAGELMQAEKEEERRLDKAVLEMEQAYNEKQALKQSGKLMQTTKEKERRLDKEVIEMEQAYNEKQALMQAGELMQAEKDEERRLDKEVLEMEQAYNEKQVTTEPEAKIENLQAVLDAAFETFAKAHTPPTDMQKIIENNKKILANSDYLSLKGEDGSIALFAKGNDVHRIFNADNLRQYIEENRLASLEVPKKWVYEVNDEWKVFAEYINGTPISQPASLNLKEVQDLVSFVEKTGYSDFGFDNNIIRDSRNGKLVFIDVEDASFKGNLSKRQLTNIMFSAMIPYMDNDALQWSENYSNFLQNNPEGEVITGYFPVSGKWVKDFYDYAEKYPEGKYQPISDPERVSTKIRRMRNEQNRKARQAWLERAKD